MHRALLLLLLVFLAPDAAAREDAKTRRDKRVARLIETLDNQRPTYRAKAAEVLGKLGVESASEKLLALLNDPDDRVRVEAAGALGRLRCPEALEPLLRLLEGTPQEVLLAAVTALGRLGDPRAAKPVLAVLTEDPKRWLPIAVALGRLGDKQGLPALKRIYDAVPAGQDKADVAAAIGKIQPGLGVELLGRLVKEQDPGTVFAALHAAGEMNNSAGAKFLLERVAKMRALYEVAGPELVRDALAAAIGAFRDEKLLRLFVDDAKREKRDPQKPADKLILVLRALAVAANPKTWSEVYPYLRDSEQEVVLSAIAAAGKLGDPRAKDPLLGYLEHGDYVVAIAAAEALGNFGDDAAIDPLITKLDSPDFRIRFAAAKALAQLRSEDVVEPIIRCLENASDWLPKELAAILKDLTGQDLLTGGAGWRGWWEKNKSEFRVWYEEDHAK